MTEYGFLRPDNAPTEEAEVCKPNDRSWIATK